MLFGDSYLTLKISRSSRMVKGRRVKVAGQFLLPHTDVDLSQIARENPSNRSSGTCIVLCTAGALTPDTTHSPRTWM